jgi:hypothetical protein
MAEQLSSSELNSSGDNLEVDENENNNNKPSGSQDSCDNVREDDDDEDDDEEEEDMSMIAPVVQVKYPCEYEYDEKTFRLVQDELMFLINKNTPDWWLCLRLSENLSFFVPASYLKEVPHRPGGNGSSAVKPPPRPPPPPPSSIQRFSSLDESVLTPAVSNPAVPKRSDHVSEERVYENDWEIDNDDAASTIISDLDERLNIEDKSSFSNNNNNNNNSVVVVVAVDKPSVATESTPGPVVLTTFSGGTARNRSNTITTAGSALAASKNRPMSTNGVVTTVKSDYDDRHIYQNLPLLKSTTTAAAIAVKSEVAASNRATRIIMSDNTNRSSGTGVSSLSSKTVNELNDNASGGALVSGAKAEDVKAPNDSDVENNIPVAPTGWQIEPTKYDRKCYVNEFNGERV